MHDLTWYYLIRKYGKEFPEGVKSVDENKSAPETHLVEPDAVILPPGIEEGAPAVVVSFFAEDEVQNIWNESNWKTMKSASASVLRRKHTAPEKKLEGRSSYAWGSREKRVHTGTLLYQRK